MYASTANLSLACRKLKQYPIKHPLLIDAALELTTATALMEAHYKVRDSIFWNRSTSATKKRVRKKLNHLAFDAYTSLNNAGELLNQYVDEVGITQEIQIWKEIINHLMKAASVMKKENNHEINHKQLSLL